MISCAHEQVQPRRQLVDVADAPGRALALLRSLSRSHGMHLGGELAVSNQRLIVPYHRDQSAPVLPVCRLKACPELRYNQMPWTSRACVRVDRSHTWAVIEPTGAGDSVPSSV